MIQHLLRRGRAWALACGVLGLMLPAGKAGAVPYNHITADGNWGVGEWDISTERRCVNTTTPYGATDGNVQSILVTWDHDSLYVGVEGNTWSNAELIYIDSDGLTSGSISAPADSFFQGFSAPGWNPDFVFACYDMQWGNVIGGDPQLRRIQADGSAVAYTGGRFAVHDKNTDGGHGTGLVEIAIPWSALGVHANGHIKVAAGTGFAAIKGPPVDPRGGLGGESGDELCGTDRVGGTDGLANTLDTPADVPYDLNGDGVPDNNADVTPPLVLSASSASPAPSYTGGHNQVTLQFSEVVQKSSSEVASNYQLDGAVTPISATRGTPDSTTVVLGFGTPLALGTTHTVRAVNVADRAGNVIVNNGTTNVACLCLRRIVFRVNMSLHLRTDSPPDSVVIIGNTLPLDFSNVCKIKMYDDGTHGDAVAGDSIYGVTLDFSRTQVCGAPPDTTTLEYEFNHRCTEYEGLHHVYSLSCGHAIDTLSVWWRDVAPTDFTAHPIDVIFRCDVMTTPGESIYIDGSQQPLTWTNPSPTPLLDNGVSPDSASGDRRWTARYRFPTSTFKSVDFKYLLDSLGTFTFECGNNRNVFLNDALYDTSGGALGPLVITPAAIFGQNCLGPGAVEGSAARELRLLPNLPNPFARSTRIRFQTPSRGRAELAIFDMAGHRVRTLLRSEMPAGEQSVSWDGRDEQGRRAASGVYFYRLTLGQQTTERRMMLLR